ncbi:MAG: serine protease, partial [Salinibacterium sp.]|nr:serine protease [Salinibacterium sp.]
IYTLAAEVREGNSGGPLLTLDGSVAGVIFARDAESTTIGYAMTMVELAPVAEQSAALVAQVSTGECVR